MHKPQYTLFCDIFNNAIYEFAFINYEIEKYSSLLTRVLIYNVQDSMLRKENKMNDRDGYRKKMAKELATSMGMSVDKARKIIEKTFDMMVEVLCKEDRLELRNFGVFEVTVKESRVGRNPKTGESVLIPRSHKVKFKPGKEMLIKIIEEKRKEKILISA